MYYRCSSPWSMYNCLCNMHWSIHCDIEIARRIVSLISFCCILAKFSCEFYPSKLKRTVVEWWVQRLNCFQKPGFIYTMNTFPLVVGNTSDVFEAKIMIWLHHIIRSVLFHIVFYKVVTSICFKSHQNKVCLVVWRVYFVHHFRLVFNIQNRFWSHCMCL